jgi:membrane-associated protease RseP (regulator of RpoE activity)
MPKKKTIKNKQTNKDNKIKEKIKDKKAIKKIGLWKASLLFVLLFLLTILEFVSSGQTIYFWILFVLSVIIILPNIIWLKFGLGTVFGLPLIFTMLKTKHFIKTINILGKHGKILEKISIGGLCLGFGLVGIDYWFARGKGWKRILILTLGTIILTTFFYIFLQILFGVPALAPLFLLGLVSFVLLGFGGLSIAFLLGYGVLSVISLFSGTQICPSVAPVLPGVPIPGLGVVVPLIAWVSLGLILVIHEFSHGIMLSYYKERIHSVGLILVGIIPMGAFVEQDDKSFLKKSEKKQLLVLSAGPTSNLFTLVFGVILLLVFSMLVSPLAPTINTEYEKAYSGIVIERVEDEVSMCGIVEEAPAKGKLFVGDEIIYLNGTKINNINELNLAFRSQKDLNFIVLRNEEEEEVFIEPVIFEDLNLKRIGVAFVPKSTGYSPPLLIQFASTLIQSINSILFFFVILSFAVGMFNFLPSDPLDGGRMAKIMLVPYFSFLNFKKKEETQKFIGRLFAWLFLFSILLNLIPYLTMII